MVEFYATVFFIYGICIGSFLNVVIYRLPLEKSLGGRSGCPNCNRQIKAIELIPVFSWVFLGGKCKGCKQKISFIYPLIELTVGGLFVLAYLQYGLSVMTFIMIIFWSMLLVIAIIDLQTKYIFDITLIVTIAPIIILSFFTDYNVVSQLISSAVCFGFYLLIYKAAYKYYGREGFGFGDVYLIGVVGYVVNIRYMYLTIFLPMYIAVIFYIVTMLYFKISKSDVKVDRKYEMPFGPAIATSAFFLTVNTAWAEQFMTRFFG